MQVALATLWSCFPVSASGADVLLFSLLHTSSGSCCSPETNHGLLRLSHSPFFFLSLSLSLCFLSLSPYCFFSPRVLSISLSLSCSLCFPLVTPKQPSLSMGIQGAQGKGRGQNLSEAALPGEKRESQETSLSSTPLLSLSFRLYSWFHSPEKDAASPLLPHRTFTCSTCIIAGVWLQGTGGSFSWPCWRQTLSVAYRQEAAKFYYGCCVVIQSRLFISVRAPSSITKQQ